MPEPILYGADYSVYTRIVRLALLEKAVSFRFKVVDVFAAGGPPAAYLRRHPFGRIPAFVHGAVSLYEAVAISNYVDAAFPGPTLRPADASGRAGVLQVCSLLDSYAFGPLVMDIYVERVAAARRGRAADEARIAAALPLAVRCLDALASLLGERRYLVGDAMSLADLHAAPIFSYFLLAEEGSTLLARYPALAAWWDGMGARESVRMTRFPAETAT